MILWSWSFSIQQAEKEGGAFPHYFSEVREYIGLLLFYLTVIGLSLKQV